MGEEEICYTETQRDPISFTLPYNTAPALTCRDVSDQCLGCEGRAKPSYPKRLFLFIFFSFCIMDDSFYCFGVFNCTNLKSVTAAQLTLCLTEVCRELPRTYSNASFCCRRWYSGQILLSDIIKS